MNNRIYTKNIVDKEGEEVTLAGWVASRRDHGKIIFLDLRDTSGVAQIVISTKNQEVYDTAQSIRDEWVIRVVGTVQKRPANMENAELATGKFEISVKNLTVLSKANTLPFPIDTEGTDVAEEIRLKYRYLDLRRPYMAEMLKLKQSYKSEISSFLLSRGFLHVDTPLLTKSTPEGARDFLVPSRNYPGKFYALPQSPQQYKQLLMIAGVEKYFQFARCFRDEDLRQDRLLEFEQLDIEMAFVDQEDVLSLVEELIIFVSEKVLGKKIQEKPFPKMSYKEVMEKYKTDKPDLRKNKDDKDLLAYLWIVDFPMFEKREDGSIGAMHHPFTAMAEEDIKKLKGSTKDILSIKAKQYDIALNGHEVFGGSIRTHDAELLSQVFGVLGHSKNEVADRFGHLLEAFSYGVPPHGGIAASDRWFMVMVGAESIREVVAFPTGGTGRTAVMDAPSEVDPSQLKELGLEIIKKKK